MKYLLFLLLTFTGLSTFAQPCADEDTVRNNAVSLITATTARVNGTTSHFAATVLSIQLRYVRVGFTDTATASASGTNPLRNLTGLQSGTQYRYYYTSVCGSGTLRQSGVYTFTTATAGVVYATERSTVFPYVKVDTGLIIPRLATLNNYRQATTGGSIAFRTTDSLPYYWNGAEWKYLAVDSAGILPALNRKVDSVTVAGDTLLYWINGTGYGEILPSAVNIYNTSGSLTGNRTVDGNTNNLSIYDVDELSLQANDQSSFQTISGSFTSAITLPANNDLGISVSNSSNSKSSSIGVGENSISIYPSLGVLKIDSLATGVGTKALRWNPATGNVTAADTTAGGSPSLTSTYVGYGDGSGLLTGSSDFTWDGSLLNVIGNVNTISNSVLFNGNVNYTGGMLLLEDNGTFSIGELGNANGNKISIEATNDLAYYDNTAHTGKFGVNTSTPGATVDIVGDRLNLAAPGSDGIALIDRFSTDGIRGLTDGGADNIAVYDAPNGKYYFGSAGVITTVGALVGINTSTPTVALDVVGDVKVKGDAFDFLGSTLYPDGLFAIRDATGQITIGDAAFDVNGTSISVDDGAQIIGMYANNGVSITAPVNITGTLMSSGVNTLTDLSGTGTRTVLADASGILSAPISDSTTKKFIKPLTNGLSTLMKFKPVTFQYKKEFENYGKGQQVGFIAQDIQKILPNSTYTNNSNGKMGYNEIDIVPVLVQAVQELSAKVDKLEKQNADLVKKLAKNPKKITLKY